MQTKQHSKGRWIHYDTRNAFIAQIPPNAYELLTTDSANSWGYVVFDTDIVIPIAYADMGLAPIAVRCDERLYVGIDEILVGYNLVSRSPLFRHKMPTVFQEFVRFDANQMIVRDEIGFIGLSYDGIELWNFCSGIVFDYTIDESKISGENFLKEDFEFIIPAKKI